MIQKIENVIKLRNDHMGRVCIPYDYENGDGLDLYDYPSTPLSSFLNHKNNSIQNKDIVYLTKASEISRPKFKLYIEEKNLLIDKTNRINYANTYVISLEQIKTLYDKSSYEELYIIPKQDMIDFLIQMGGYEQIIKFIKKENNNNIEYILLNKFKYNEEIQYGVDLSNYPTEMVCEKYYHGAQKYNNLVEVFNTLCPILSKAKIVFDETLYENIGKTFGNVINKDIYNDLCNMLSSNDAGNVNMGTEIIANSDYVSSKFYILFLLNEYYNNIRSCENKTINFKNCLSYFKNYKFEHNWDVLINQLINTEGVSMSEENKQILKEYVIKRVNQIVGKNNIKDITF